MTAQFKKNTDFELFCFCLFVCGLSLLPELELTAHLKSWISFCLEKTFPISVSAHLSLVITQ